MARIQLFGDDYTIVRELKCGRNREYHKQPLFRMHFFKRDEDESDVMEEVTLWNVLFMFLELITYCPFEKGTSDEEKMRGVLDKVIRLVSAKES